MTVVIRKDAQQVLAWTDPTTNQSGLASVLGFVARVLQSQEESGGLFIGDLIIHLMRKAGEAVLPVLPELLQAMLLRMKTATTATFIQVLSQDVINGWSNSSLILVESDRPVQFLDSQPEGHDSRAPRVFERRGRLWVECVRSDSLRKCGNIPRVLAVPGLYVGLNFSVCL